MAKETELKAASLPEVNRNAQKPLHLFCLWYQQLEDRSCWRDSFDEHTLAKFENDRFRDAVNSSNTVTASARRLEKDLEHVCNVIEMIQENRWRLADLQITTVADLLSRQDELELFALDLTKTTQKTLLKICLWNEDFHNRNSRDACWGTEFNDESFSSFEQVNSDDRDYRRVLDLLSGETENDILEIVDDKICQYAARITNNSKLSKELKKQCHGKFKSYDVALKCHRALMHPTGSPDDLIYVVSRQTQSGKSTVKAVAAAVHQQLDCFLIIIF